MTSLEVGFAIPTTAEELFALIGDPMRDPAQPFTLILYVGDRPIGKAPVGIYSVPTKVGLTIRSEWPARFFGPLEAMTSWELLTAKDAHVAGAKAASPTLRKGDCMECSVTLRGEEPCELRKRKRWWNR